MTTRQSPEQSSSDPLDDLLNHLVFKEGDGANGSGGEIRYWKSGKDITAKQAILDWHLQKCRSYLPSKKNLAYRQGRNLPVLTGIEEKDQPHVKAKKYINYGYNQCLVDITKRIEEE